MAKKILIVDDNEKNRLLIKDILSYHGYEVLEAENGDIGFRMAKKHKPDLIFLDLQMPVLNGFGAAKALKDDPDTEDIKIIAITSFAMKGDRDKIIELGVDDYVSKPIDTRQLPLLVKKYIG